MSVQLDEPTARQTNSDGRHAGSSLHELIFGAASPGIKVKGTFIPDTVFAEW